MAERFVSVEIQATVHQVYSLFTHFNDFPKFMRFVKEVTYYDKERSHWVVQMAGRHEWDAINEGWIEDRQVGWRSLNGLENSGRVTFIETGTNVTQMNVFLHFQPPGGAAGSLGEFVMGDRLQGELQEDLQHFACMVEEAPPDALDPMSSHFLFHEKSAVATGTTTENQKRAMSDDPMMSPQELERRRETIAQEKTVAEREENERVVARQHETDLLEQTRQRHEAALERQAILNREEEQRKQARLAREAAETGEISDQNDSTLDTLGGRNAAAPETPLGDRDARNERFPDYHRGPDAVSPKKALDAGVEIEKTESPWRRAIRGEEPIKDQEEK
jgi:hypothetical protein